MILAHSVGIVTPPNFPSIALNTCMNTKQIFPLYSGSPQDRIDTFQGHETDPHD